MTNVDETPWKAPCRRGHAGAYWIESSLKTWKKPPPSALGRAVADFLGELFLGIYHIAESSLESVEWSNDYVIAISLRQDFATVDFDLLTRLVLLAHERCLRVTIGPRTFRHVELMFHRRKRSGSLSERHPTIENAIERHRQAFGPLVREPSGEVDVPATSS